MEPAAIAMRRRAALLKREGYVQSAVWFDPAAIRTLNKAQKALGHATRSDTVNALLKYLAADKRRYQEFLAVTT